MYVTNSSSNTVSVIDTATNIVIATINVDINVARGLCGITVSPDGTKLYVTNNGYAISTLYVIDTTTNTVTARVKVGIRPHGVAISPDGTKVYVTNIDSGTVSVVDTVTNTVKDTINVGKAPYGVSVTPNGKNVYVANQLSDSVSIIDIETNKVTATVNALNSPIAFGQFIGSLPIQPVLPIANFSTNVSQGYAPLSVQFTNRSENETSRNWDFENNGNIDSTEETPVYVYTNPGIYTVNLTVSNSNGTDSKLATITVWHSQYLLPSPVTLIPRQTWTRTAFMKTSMETEYWISMMLWHTMTTWIG